MRSGILLRFSLNQLRSAPCNPKPFWHHSFVQHSSLSHATMGDVNWDDGLLPSASGADNDAHADDVVILVPLPADDVVERPPCARARPPRQSARRSRWKVRLPHPKGRSYEQHCLAASRMRDARATRSGLLKNMRIQHEVRQALGTLRKKRPTARLGSNCDEGGQKLC